MRVFLVLSLAAIVVVFSWIFCAEIWMSRRAEDALREGNGREALALYEQLHRQSQLVFLDQGDIEIGREQAAIVALKQVVAAHDFILATHLINLILDGTDSGCEAEARSIATTLPEFHLDWTAQLLAAGKVHAALQQCSAMRQLYAGQSQILVRVRQLEWQGQLAKARALLEEEGDLQGVLDVVSELGDVVSLPVRSQAEALALAAVKHTADRYYAQQDYPGLYRMLVRAMTHLQRHPYLLRQLERVQEEYDRRLFGVPATREAEDVAIAVPVGTSNFPGRAVLTIRHYPK